MKTAIKIDNPGTHTQDGKEDHESSRYLDNSSAANTCQCQKASILTVKTNNVTAKKVIK